MSQEAVEAFLGRIITDAIFRQHAHSSLEFACASAGLNISSQELTCLRALDLTIFGRVADNVDGAILRS